MHICIIMRNISHIAAFWTMNTQKVERHDTLREIIESERISRQDRLVELLRKKGFEATQSSVSRDLDELGIVKASGVYTSASSALHSPFGDINVFHAGTNLVIIRCESGLASAVAVKIDSAGIDEIVGTIAGDDTIFVATNGESAQRNVVRRLWEILSR